MSKPKVEPLHTLIRGIQHIVLLLLLGHGIPLPITDLVAPNIKGLDTVEEKDVDDANGQENLVSATIQRLVVVAVNVGGGNVARLHKHVVQRGADGAGAHAVAVLGVPADENGMAVRVAQQARDEGIANPRRDGGRQRHQGHEPGEDPNVGKRRQHGALLAALREPREQDEVHRVQKLRRNRQQVRLEDGEANLSQDEGQVRRERRRRNVHEEADEVERPLLPVLDGGPEQRDVDGLSVVVISMKMRFKVIDFGGLSPVVHVALAGIVSKETVHHDVLLVVGEPALLATEPVLGLTRSRRHVTPGDDADEKRGDTLKEEASREYVLKTRFLVGCVYVELFNLQPSPTSPAVDASHL